jgi:ABC-type sugar transport system permease subunit
MAHPPAVKAVAIANTIVRTAFIVPSLQPASVVAGVWSNGYNYSATSSMADTAHASTGFTSTACLERCAPAVRRTPFTGATSE